MSIIPSAYYTLNPTAKTITFLTPYDSISAEEILSIRNISKQIDVYNSSDPRKHISMSDQTGADIELTDGVLTYVVTAGMEDDDILQIAVDVDNYSLSNISDLFTAQSVAASTTVKSSTPIQTGKLSKLSCYVSNSGASTDCTVDVYASPTTSTTGRKKTLATFTLGAGSVTTDETGNGIDPKQLDNFIWAEITNSDTVNAAVITVQLSMFR